MAIDPGYKTFTFDGKRSGDYNTYITGSAVYNAPEREVEMIEIPGRNGAFALDKGRFQNIEVTYPAGIYAESQEDFAKALSDLRNMLCSRTGYCRLEDEYNPDEYRMAVYKSGLDVDPVAFQRAGEFNIVFDCKPQRFLKSGETKQTITLSGDTITNPTLFEASPLLEIKGYGTIVIGGENVTLNNVTIGNIKIVNAYTTSTFNRTWHVWSTFSTDKLNTGDELYFPEQKLTLIENWTYPTGSIGWIDEDNLTNIVDNASSILSSSSAQFIYTIPAQTYTLGTSATSVTSSGESRIWDGGTGTGVTWSIYSTYDGINRFDVHISISQLSGSTTEATVYRPEVMANSTKTILGNTNYIDLDIGEAWTDDSGTIISINNVVELPAELPTLASGANTITYDNTITSLKITPRWWKV